MSGTALISLVGEQPAPNLLPTRHLRPDQAVLVHTERTEGVAERLRGVLEQEGIGCFLCRVDPYDLPAIRHSLQQFIEQHVKEYEVVFNLTGGTKPMALAAFLTALHYKSDFFYYQTEGGHSKLFHYGFGEDGQIVLKGSEELSKTITLDDYLRVQVGSYNKDKPRNEFEQQVDDALRSIPDLEVLNSMRPQGLEALEVDFVIRLGNQVGVIEAKTKGAKSGIDQIQAVAEPRYLGTYVAKFLISGQPVDRNNKNLAKAYNIEVIEMPSYASTDGLSEEDKENLRRRILEKMGGR